MNTASPLDTMTTPRVSMSVCHIIVVTSECHNTLGLLSLITGAQLHPDWGPGAEDWSLDWAGSEWCSLCTLHCTPVLLSLYTVHTYRQHMWTPLHCTQQTTRTGHTEIHRLLAMSIVSSCLRKWWSLGNKKEITHRLYIFMTPIKVQKSDKY